MLKYVLKRFVYMIVMLIVVSFVGFFIIQLPPGDFITTYAAQLEASGESLQMDEVEALRAQYGLDEPFMVQYWIWITGVLQGDFGYSFDWKKPVNELIGDRITVTIIISLVTLIVTYITAIAFGLYSGSKQYGAVDYFCSIMAFIGMSIPNFVLTIFLVYIGFQLTGSSMTGLFSPEYVDAPWSIGRLIDMAKHMPIAVIVGSSMAISSLFRVTRSTMLDEINKTYVTAARARGLSETKLLLKYPAKVVMNPIVSSMNWVLPNIISGGTIIGIILSLPTIAPLLLDALKSQDMYLAGILVVFLAFLAILGTFISDLMLLFIDPRIRLE